MNPTRMALAATLAIAVGGALQPAIAAWPNDPAVNVRVAPSGGDQWLLYNVEDGAGGTFFVWSEGGNVRAQHLTSQGLVSPGWPANGITVCGAVLEQYPSSVAADGAGGFIAAWDDYRGGTGSPDVYAQRINADGTPVWTANGVAVCTAADYQFNARVCSDRAGGAILVWQDRRNLATNGDDVYAQRVLASGALLWTATGLPICTVVGTQDWASVVSDGSVGGAYFAWQDSRVADANLYTSHVDRNGNLLFPWTSNGNAVCAVAGDQQQPAMISDGAYGAILTWLDFRSGFYDIYAARIDGTGPTATGWTVGGVALTSDATFQYYPYLAPDGAGGAIVMWYDLRNANGDLYAQRISMDGVTAWAAGGVPVTTAPGDQTIARIVSDGAGGAVVGWMDNRAGFPPMVYAQRITSTGAIAPGFTAFGTAIATAHWVQEIAMCSDGAGGAVLYWQHNAAPQAGYAQRLDRWGYLGAQPQIVSVKDVPNDQGGRVKLSWNRSPLDAYPDNAIGSYLVYRSVPPLAAQAALARGEAVLADARSGDDAPVAAGRALRRTFLTSQFAATTYYWEQLAYVSAGQLPGYSYLAATAQDSVGGSNPKTLFMVRAQDVSGSKFWLSDPDSGYSADNLPPAAPVPFTGAYAAGATHLHWDPNSEPDFAYYNLYRGSTGGFVPGPASLVAARPDTGYLDVGAAGSYYKLTAVDSHGNESPASLLAPSGTLDAPGWVAGPALALAPAMPNPSARATTCRFTLPVEGPVRVTVHDAAGRIVRVLVDARMPAGVHAVRWEGEDGAGGRVPSGLYIARLAFAGRTLTGKIVRVR